jgi:hypothetical protein
MHHNELKSDKNNPTDEQTLHDRYPNANFKGKPELIKETLSGLIIKMSEAVKKGDITSINNLLQFILGDVTQKLVHDFLIDAAKNMHYDIVKLMTGQLVKKGTSYTLVGQKQKVDKRIIRDILNNFNEMELILCAQDTPTEVLKIINDMSPAQCANLLLNNYFYNEVYVKLMSARYWLEYSNLNQSIVQPTSITTAITNIKFLCEVVKNNYLSNELLLAAITATICEYIHLIWKYKPQAIKELSSIIDLTKSLDLNKYDLTEVLGCRYPNANFYIMPELASVTLSKLIIKMSEKNELLSLIVSDPQLFHDFIIEAVKNNHYDLVKLITGTVEINERYHNHMFYLPSCYRLVGGGRKAVTTSIIESSINSCNSNKIEVIMCAQDTPTEVLQIINDMRTFPCIDLLLDNYFYFNVCQPLGSTEEQSAQLYFMKPNSEALDTNSLITNIKFLCKVIKNNNLNESLLAKTATTICDYQKLIRKYDPQAINELSSILNLKISMEKGEPEVARLKNS